MTDRGTAVPYVLGSGAAAFWGAIATGALALGIVGGTMAALTDRSPLLGATRMLLLGTITATVTFGIGYAVAATGPLLTLLRPTPGADLTLHGLLELVADGDLPARRVVNDAGRAVGRAIAASGHGALLMVDAIASLATMPFEMEAWGVDVAVTGSQKGLMTPPGLGLVAAGPRAAAAHQSAGLRTAYWDWTKRDGTVHYQKYCGTPPEHLLFGLRQAIDMLFEEGLEAVFERHRLLVGFERVR